jgi:hypothetical protein
VIVVKFNEYDSDPLNGGNEISGPCVELGCYATADASVNIVPEPATGGLFVLGFNGCGSSTGLNAVNPPPNGNFYVRGETVALPMFFTPHGRPWSSRTIPILLGSVFVTIVLAREPYELESRARKYT